MSARVLLLIATSISIAADAPKEEAAKKELKKMQGDWVMQSSERDGKKMSKDQIKGYSRTVRDDKYTVTIEDEQGVRFLDGKFSIEPSKGPRAIDAQLADGPMKGKTMLGIYKFEGDTQMVCFAPPGKKRPTAFDSNQGTLTVWKRAKK